MRLMIVTGILLWSVCGIAMAALSVDDVNADAKGLVALATLVGVLAAVGAVPAFLHGHVGRAIALLVISLIIPTYAAWIFSLMPLLLIAAILLSIRHSPRSPGTET